MEQVGASRAFELRIQKAFHGVEGCLLAVSGGADSMAMAAACQVVGVRHEIACLDHGLRPESAAEVEVVRAWAQQHGTPFHTRQLGLTPGTGVEARARAARYAALGEVARERGLTWIATAHTASDQAETLLMRLMRGTALRGAAGILSERADGVIRPLLFATRRQTVQYVTHAGIAVVDDPMNHDSSFLRVRVRNELVPALDRLSDPGVTERLAHFARLAHEDDAWLQSEAMAALARVQSGEALDLHATRSLGLPIRRRVLAAWLDAHGLPLDGHHLDDACEAISEGRDATLPHDRVLIVDRQLIRVALAPPRLHGSSSGDDGRSRR